MRKRAITPLISALALIFFAIVLGVLVMSWGKDAYEVDGPEVCENAGIRVISVGEDIQACYKGDNIYFTLENSGEAKLSGAMVSVIGSNDIYQGDLQVMMNVAEIKRAETDYNVNVGEIMQLRLAPKLNGENACANNIFKVDNIRECS
jgi:hypothetical protein|tara:strand:+ start:294 stop:737 length:444 start_codon:yes stop_codon:yes gene_type:complete